MNINTISIPPIVPTFTEEDSNLETDRLLSLTRTTEDLSEAVDKRGLLISEALLERFIGDEQLLDRYKCIRRLAKTTSMIASAASGAMFIPVSLRLPAPIGFLCAPSNFIAYFALDIWAISATLDDILGPRGKKIVALFEQTNSEKCRLSATAISALFAALLSQVPTAAPCLTYYDEKYKIPAFIVSLAGLALLPTRSMQLSINAGIELRTRMFRDIRNQIAQARSEMITLIQENRQTFIQMGYKDKIELLDRLRPMGSVEKKIQACSLEIFKLSSQPSKKHLPNCLCSRVSCALGILLTLSLEAGLSIYTWSQVKEYFVDNDYFAGVLTTLVIGSGIFLNGKSVVETTQRITNDCVNFLTCRKEKSIANQFRPKLTLSLKLVGLIINGLAIGTTIVIWDDFLKDEFAERLYFESTLCTAYFLLLSTATFDLVDNFIEQLIILKGSKEEQSIVQLSQKFQQLEQMLSMTSISDFSFFLSHMPQEIKESILTKVSMKREQLDEYIASCNEN